MKTTKKRLIILSAFVILFVGLSVDVNSQILSKEKFANFYSNKSKLLGDDGWPAIGESAPITLLTASIPFRFSRIEKDDDGEWQIGTNFSFGGSYAYVIGKGTRLQGDAIRVEPQFIIGIGGDIGFSEGNESMETSFCIGGILGFKSITATIGFDFTRERMVIGTGVRIESFSITEKLTKVLSFN